MRLHSLSKFLSLVTPERLEEYLRERGWTPGNHRPGVHREWFRSVGNESRFILVPHFGFHPELRDEYFARAIEEHPWAENVPVPAVLFDLLPPEHRGELVEAVFPELEAAPLAGLPRFLMLNPFQAAEILLVRGLPTLGSVQRIPSRQEGGVEVVAVIELRAEQTRTQLLHILIHELIHLAAETLKEFGVIHRQPDEAFVTNASGPLFAALACNGLLTGISIEEARAQCWGDDDPEMAHGAGEEREAVAG